MNFYESTGKSVEEAISEGLKKLGLSIGEVQVDILEEGSKGLFGLFGSKMARVKLTVKEEESAAPVFADSLSSYDAERRSPQKTQRAVSSPESRKTQDTKARRAPKADKAQSAPPAKAEPSAKTAKPARSPGVEKVEKPEKTARAPKAAKTQQPAVPVVPADQKDPDSDEGKVQSFLQDLTRLMGLEISVHVHTDEEGNIRVNMQGDTLGILIGRRGETLDAIQYLTSLHLNRGRQEYTRVTLDSEGYRAKREDALVRLANRMANRAQRTGRKVSMEPMNPYERRILHSALQNHEGISTHSEGEEPNRYVVITVNREAKPQQTEKE